MTRRKWPPKKWNPRNKIPYLRECAYASMNAQLFAEIRKKQRESEAPLVKKNGGFMEEFHKVFSESAELQEIVESRYDSYRGNGWKVPTLSLVKQATHDVAQLTEVDWTEWWNGMQVIGESLNLNFPMSSLKLIFEGTRAKMK